MVRQNILVAMMCNKQTEFSNLNKLEFKMFVIADFEMNFECSTDLYSVIYQTRNKRCTVFCTTVIVFINEASV